MLSSFIIRLILIKRIINKKSWKIQLKLRYIIYNNLYNITNKLQIIDFFQNFLIILTCQIWYYLLIFIIWVILKI